MESCDGDPCYVCGLQLATLNAWFCPNLDCGARVHASCCFDLAPEAVCPNARCARPMDSGERERAAGVCVLQQRIAIEALRRHAADLEAKLMAAHTESTSDRTRFFAEVSRWNDERRVLYRRLAALEGRSQAHSEAIRAHGEAAAAATKKHAEVHVEERSERSERGRAVAQAVAEDREAEKEAAEQAVIEEREEGARKLADERGALYRAIAEERATSERRICEERAGFLSDLRSRDRDKDAALRALERRLDAAVGLTRPRG